MPPALQNYNPRCGKSHGLENPSFADAPILRNIKLVFPSGIMRQPIKIKTVKFKRFKKNSEKTGYEAAFEFDEISTGE